MITTKNENDDDKDSRMDMMGNSTDNLTATANKSTPSVERTRYGGSCGTTPFFLNPGECAPEYDQGRSVIVWYDDLYNLADDKAKATAALTQLREGLQALQERCSLHGSTALWDVGTEIAALLTAATERRA